MDYQALLQNRRAIRDFQDRELPLSILKEMLQETCLAPTASNGQPCRFIIIRDREFMKRLSTESKDNLLADVAANPALPLKKYEAVLRDEGFNIFYNAPCWVPAGSGWGPRSVPPKSSRKWACPRTAKSSPPLSSATRRTSRPPRNGMTRRSSGSYKGNSRTG